MAEIVIKIKKGKTTFEVNGVSGVKCEELTKALEQAVGKVEDVQRKPAFFVELDDIQQKIYEG